EDGSIHHEQLFGTIGFDGMSSLLYHLHPPTMVKELAGQKDLNPEIVVDKNMKMRSLLGYDVKPTPDFLDSRLPVLVNSDLQIVLASPQQSLKDYFYKNADSDEVIFVHQGSGKLKTQLGNIEFSYGDYLVVPRGMIYQINFDTQDNRLLIVESRRPIYTPKRYRNWFGQLLEHSPFCERDIRPPSELETIEHEGE